MTADGTIGVEVSHKVEDGAKFLDALKSVRRGKSVSVKARMGMFKGIVLPRVL